MKFWWKIPQSCQKGHFFPSFSAKILVCILDEVYLVTFTYSFKPLQCLIVWFLQVRSVDVKEALRLQKENNFVILDVRPEAEFKEVYFVTQTATYIWFYLITSIVHWCKRVCHVPWGIKLCSRLVYFRWLILFIDVLYHIGFTFSVVQILGPMEIRKRYSFPTVP